MKTVFWETTKMCNMKCSHCSNDSNSLLAGELTCNEVLSLISTLVGMGLNDFRFYGGEPFLRKDILRVVDFLVEKIPMSFYTNGTILDDFVCGILEKSNNPRIFVSLDSTAPSLHDSIRGLEGAFKLVTRNIKSLVAQGYRVDIIMDNI